MTRTHEMLKRITLGLLRKGQPGGAAVHQPSPEWNAGTRRRRRASVAAAVAKSLQDDPGQYIGRQLLNADALTAWWAGARKPGEPDLDPNPHVTISYSRQSFPWVADRVNLVVVPEQFERFGVLGADMAVVLHMDSPALEATWKATRAAGATWDHGDSFQPHMTLFYLGAGYDSTAWRDGSDKWPALPDFPLVLGPELVGPRGVDVFEAAKAPAWYVMPART